MWNQNIENDKFQLYSESAKRLRAEYRRSFEGALCTAQQLQAFIHQCSVSSTLQRMKIKGRTLFV